MPGGAGATEAEDPGKASGPGAQEVPEESAAHGGLRRNASAPSLDANFKENIIMTVRRYSVASNMLKVDRKGDSAHKTRKPEEKSREIQSKWGKAHEALYGRSAAPSGGPTRDEHSSSGGGREKLTNRRSLQDYVHKNRAKVKTVTFLLPVDDIYTSRPVLANTNLIRTDSSGE